MKQMTNQTASAKSPAPTQGESAEACQLEYAWEMPELPAALLQDDITTVDKLVYLWIKQHPGEWSDRTLTAALGLRTHNALRTLIGLGLLQEESPPAGRRAGTYRAAPISKGPR